MSGKAPSKPPAEAGRREDSERSGNSGKTAERSSSRNDHLPRRIADSAVGLSSSVLASGSLGSLRPEDLGLADKGRAGPSNSSHGAAADEGLVHHGVGTSRTSRPRLDEKDKSEEKFQEFLGNPSPNIDDGAFMTEKRSRDAEQPGAQGHTVDRQEMHDGEEVAALLADPDSLQFTDSVDFGSVPAQLPRLRAALQGEEGTPSSAWDHLLNFWPVADENLKSSKSAWLGQWKDVLTRYTDEVWGELGTDARQAKEEVDAELQRDQDGERELQSLRRLRQILAHLRGS